MVGIRAGVEICLVTAGTGVGCSGIISVVAGIAVIGNGNMAAGKRIYGAMVKSRRCPGRFGMAGSAIGRELRCGVVRFGRGDVVGVVATVAGIGRVVVVAVVAGCAIICNSRMRPVERVKSIVDRECRRLPAGHRGMARRTIRRDIQRHVVRISRLVEIGCMASRTLCRCSGITSCMTVDTICRKVRAGQVEIGVVVIKNISRIAGRVAGKASRIVV